MKAQDLSYKMLCGRFPLLYLLVSFIILASPPVAAQASKSPRLGLDIGIGYNQLTWEAATSGSTGTVRVRDAFPLIPTLRVVFDVSSIDHLLVSPFVGYNRFGGKSGVIKDFKNYEDEFVIDALELGLITAYEISSFHVGIGLKHSRHLNMVFHYTEIDLQNNRTWREEDGSIFLKNNSTNAGLKVTYLIDDHLRVSSEAWFGISSLERKELAPFIELRENHFRVLFGVRL